MRPIATLSYVSAEFIEREREHIFKRAWLNLCRAEDLPKIGDFKVFEIAVWSASILLVHGKDGMISLGTPLSGKTTLTTPNQPGHFAAGGSQSQLVRWRNRRHGLDFGPVIRAI